MVCETENPPFTGVYVRVDGGRESFIARILDGPFYAKGGDICYYKLELTAMMINGHTTAVRSRPKPKSSVALLDAESIQGYLGMVGDIKLGKLLGQSDVRVSLDSMTLTRHVGIFGTTGSGKSNSLQVLAEESSQANRSVLIFDIEGEYLGMNEATEDLVAKLSEFGNKPEGVRDFRPYVPAAHSSINPDAKRFSIPFEDLDLEVFSDVLGLTSFERFYLLELAARIKETAGDLQGYNIDTLLGALRKRIEAQMDKGSNIPEMVAEAHMGLFTKLSLAKRTGILDAPFEKISPEDFCGPGRISVIDLSDASDILRNICVAHFLKEVFKYKARNPTSTPLTVFVEEIHTFISTGKSSKMLATITMLTEMARQGRKRGLSLGIVSQQPALLPAELIELCNTRFIHKIGSTPNLQALQKSTGNVPDSLWALLPSLGKGEVLIATPKFEHAIVAQVRPNKSKRLRVEFG
jgi:DNA helicase HerA-like ATPase